MEKLRTEVSEKSSRLDHLKAELCNKTTELSNLKQETIVLEEQLDSTSQTVKKLEVQQQASTVLINEQNASITAANEEKLRLEKIVSEYKEKAEWLSAENDKLEKSMDILDAQHQDVIQQLIESRDDLAEKNRDLSLCLAAQSETSSQLDMDSSRIDNSKPEPVEVSPSDGSSLPSERTDDSTVDAVEEEEAAQRECDLVRSHATAEQSSDTDGELKACREELHHLQSVMMEREKSYTDRIAQLSAELESCLLSRHDKCSDCLSKDRLIDDLSGKTRSLEDDQQRLVGELESCREEFEDEQRRCKAEITQLHRQVEELVTKLQHTDKQLASCPADDTVATLRAEIESLKVDLGEKESVCKLYESEVERLTRAEDQLTKEIERQQKVINRLPGNVNSGLPSDLSDELSRLRDKLFAREHELKRVEEENCWLLRKVDEMSSDVEQLQQKVHESAASDRSARTCSEHGVPVGCQTSEVDLNVAGNSSEMSRAEPRDGDTRRQLNDRVASDSKEIVQLRSTVSRQKEMLDALKAKYASVRGLIGDRSHAQHGSSVLSDVYRLELELREVRADRERLLAVLTENTRETGALRAEVHRLTSVAAASQAALMKAQRDAQQIAMQSHQEANQDMKNEAVKKLSQIIKDKDMEIDALQLKNATLVQV